MPRLATRALTIFSSYHRRDSYQSQRWMIAIQAKCQYSTRIFTTFRPVDGDLPTSQFLKIRFLMVYCWLPMLAPVAPPMKVKSLKKPPDPDSIKLGNVRKVWPKQMHNK